MKYVLLCIVMFALLNDSNAQKKIPSSILKEFEQKFTRATNTRWHKENAKEYEVEFVSNGVNYSASFSTNGTWLETETTQSFSTFPEAVQANFNKQHKNAKKMETAKIEKADGTVLYEIEVKINRKRKDILYKADSTIYK